MIKTLIAYALLARLQSWYLSQCDGDWEHGAGIKILSIDNPGWSIEINLENTAVEGLTIPCQLVKQSEQDWYGISIEKALFLGVGDPTKLEFLLLQFKALVETNS